MKSALDMAHESNNLWPTISDALDILRRRIASETSAYERIWRIIHLWECIAKTLSSTAASRLIELTSENSGQDDQVGNLRIQVLELMYGRRADPPLIVLGGPGALSGSIDKWLDVLFFVRSIPEEAELFQDPYINCLGSFLRTETDDISRFVNAWRIAHEIPSSVVEGKMYVARLFKMVNTFRNGFAHLPYPHDPLEKISEALWFVTCQLFSLAGSWEGLESPQGNVLCGSLIYKGQSLRGMSNFQEEADGAPEGLAIKWPSRGVSPLFWIAEPFFHVDGMLRPHLLSRLADRDDAKWEYSRFKAEANAVVFITNRDYYKLMPPPVSQPKNEEPDIEVVPENTLESAVPVSAVESTEYERGVQQFLSVRDPALMNLASDLILNGSFEQAIALLRPVTQKRPNYHVAWLLLGRALREFAVRQDEWDAQYPLFQEALQALGIAIQHIDPNYRARAYYERSKVFYQLGGSDSDQKLLESARVDAMTALNTSYEPKYATWVDRLSQDVHRFVRDFDEH